MTHLTQFLNYIPVEQFKIINKTPIWIDKVILQILSEHQQNEMLSWISDSGKHITDFIKRISNKYKYWLDVGQELHLLK